MLQPQRSAFRPGSARQFRTMATAVSVALRAPQWVLTYLGADISADISAMVIDVSYLDHLTGLSGEIELTIDDTDHLWQGPCHPSLGDQVSLALGLRGETPIPFGD